MGSVRTLRGKVGVAGVAETTYYKRGEAPDAEFKLALEAIIKACADAGISPKKIDGFASFSNDRSDSSRLAAALGIDDLRFSNMQWRRWFRRHRQCSSSYSDRPGRMRRGFQGIGSRSVWTIWPGSAAEYGFR